MKIFLFFFIFFGCTHYQVKNFVYSEKNFEILQHPLIKKKLDFRLELNLLENFIGRDEFNKIFSTIAKFHVSPYNCRVDEIACVFIKEHPHTIFLTSEFLKENLKKRSAIIFHEALHLDLKIGHAQCLREGEYYDCDIRPNSPYQREFQFLRYLANEFTN